MSDDIGLDAGRPSAGAAAARHPGRDQGNCSGDGRVSDAGVLGLLDSRRRDVVAVVGLIAFFHTWMILDLFGQTATRWVSDWATTGAAAAATWATLSAARRAPASSRRAWTVLSFSTGFWTLGMLTWAVQQNIAGSALPIASFPDISWVISALLTVWGVAALVRSTKLSKARIVLDGLTAALALVALSWTLVLEDALGDVAGIAAPPASIFYKIGDAVVLAFLLAVLAAAPTRGRRAIGWLVAAKLVHAVANGIYTVLVADGTYATGHWLDVGWFGAFILLWAAGREGARQPADTPRHRAVQPRALLPYLPGVLAACLVVVSESGSAWPDHRVAVVSALIMVLMLVRQWVAQSELAAVHNRLIEAQSAARVGSWEQNRRTSQLLLSDQAHDVLGLEPTGEVTPVMVLGVIHADDRERARRDITAVATGSGDTVDTYRVADEGGSPRWVRVTAKRTRTGLRGTVQDVTAMRNAELAARQSQKLEALGRLSGGVAHEFNNLLTPILGYAGLVLDELQPGDPHYEDIAAIGSAADRAADVTKRFLAYCRARVPTDEVFDVGAATLEVVQLLKPLLPPSVRLDVPPPDDEAWSRGDASDVHQAILNLALNAADAMPDGGRLSIAVRVGAAEPHGLVVGDFRHHEAVVVSVADEGVGMDAATLARCLEPFFTTKQERGTGLGLAMVYGVVASMGGALGIETVAGAGTTMTMFLPLSHQRATPVPPAVAASHSPLRVVVVDDDPNVLGLARRVLGSAGHDVVTFDDGRELLAGDLAAMDVLVTDIAMPHLSGYDLAEQVQRRWPATRVVYISGYQYSHAAPEGASPDVLPKPFVPATLLAAVADQ